jgi:hypothetical protein
MNRETAIGAIMLPDPQGFLYDSTAVGTLLTGFPGTDFNNFRTSARSLVMKFCDEVRPGCVRYTFSEMVVSEHVLDAQLFHIDFGVLSDQPATEFMAEVLTLVSDFEVELSEVVFSLSPVLATLDLLAHSSLKELNSSLALSEELGIFNYNTIRQGSEVLKPDINADSFTLIANSFDIDFTGKGSKPLTRLITLNGQSLDFTFGNSVEDYGYAANLGAIQVVGRLEPETALRISEAPETLFEARETGFDIFTGFTFLDTPEEVSISLGEPISYILEGLRVDLGEGRIFSLEGFDCVNESEFASVRATFFFVDSFGISEKLVVELAAHIELGKQSMPLLSRRVNPELIHSQRFHVLLE